MRKGIRITILLAATVCMLGLFATTAYGYTGWWTPCYSCHAGAPSAATITTNVGANDGTYADFGVTVSGATEWALFAGYTKIATYSGNTTITVPAGANYDIYAVGGSPTSGSFASAAINPAGTWPDPTGDVTAPVSSSDAVATYADKAEIEITATDNQAGVQRIYYRINGGTVRTTPVGVVDGYALAVVRPTSAGTFNYTISFWSEDREGNIESPQTASFSITRSGTESVAQAGPLTTLGPNGMSQWSYQDLADSTPKYEGGYAAYGGVSGYYADPHGGYDTTTNKCKVCHAVHRAEGAYYLLRADSQDDACDYCHIGGSAHSSKVVYDLNSAGKSTNNGHTIGASTYIPDSSVAQWTEEVVLSTVDADGTPLSEVISVRAYDEDKASMYRFARHHGHNAPNATYSYVKVGPLALRCMSCHQVHNAPAQTWQSVSMDAIGPTGVYTSDEVSGYKLLKSSPSGTTWGSTSTQHGTEYYSLAQIAYVPETTLTAGVNFDDVRAMGANPGTQVLDGKGTVGRPVWVAQDFDAHQTSEQRMPAAVNNAALSVWCADCHNLNIGGYTNLTNEELGFKAHTERTHPVPYVGGYSGPGQCYSCHRNDLPRLGSGAMAACGQCHYGTGDYKQKPAGSDFPHSGEDGDYKMLGSYSIGASTTTIDDDVTIGAANLDAVCLRCHGGIGTFH